MSPIVLILYVLACAVCGIMGRKTTIGFWGHGLLAFFLTPLLDFLVLLVARPKSGGVRSGFLAGQK
jgi:hypothetical protein